MDVCKEKLALMDEYNKATVNYSKAVSLQFSKMGVVSKGEYQALQDATERERHVSADALDKLERHIASHQC